MAALFLLWCCAPAFGVFTQIDGLIIMEAEHFQSNTVVATHSWIATNDVPGFVGTAAMRALPNSGTTLSSVANSPKLTYLIQVTNSGVFKLWVRVWGANGSEDSMYVGVDGGSAQRVNFGQTGVWLWKSVEVSFTNSGSHEIYVWMREDGAYVDRILLATSLTYIPVGEGPAEIIPAELNFRWSRESGRIYVENGGAATLSDIHAALPNAPLCLIDSTNHVWFLDASLVVTDGATLRLHGSAVGGDVNELRLRSDNSSADGSCAVIDADWGTLDLNGVKVISWDQLASAPDTEYATYGRAYIRARSRQEGDLVQQSTMNVVNSEIAHLGIHSNDGYGLTWRVVGTAPAATVFGVVSNSFIHDCVLGLATELWSDVPWTGNNVVSNALYGFDPSAHNEVLGNTHGVVLRWAEVSQRIYVTGPGEATLSDIRNALPDAPLTLVAPANAAQIVPGPTNNVWYLGANLFVENGARLKLYGPAIGGDVAELRLKSDNKTNENAFVELRADWGWLDIRNTKITSWDAAANGPDIENAAYRRAYVRARSKLDPDGVTARESRMDVIDSEICYLGSQNTEAYGLTWKVVDTTAVFLPPGSTNTLFDLVNVYGDIRNSRIHHNHFGVYTYGHEGGQWLNNEVHHNIRYGFDPHDDSDNLVIENNNVHHNGWHGIIASKRCDHGVLRNNVSQHNGVSVHESALGADNSTVTLKTATLGGSNLILTVNNVTDRAAPPNIIAQNSQASFSFAQVKYPMPPGSPEDPLGPPIRVNAGGGAFVDSVGNNWSADFGFNSGYSSAFGSPISGTANDALYQTERWGTPLIYSFNLPNGAYTVNLHFAEIWDGAFAVGARVFDVSVEGQLRMDNLDIFSRVGANAALVLSLPVTLTDGQLNLSFTPVVQNPKISAIEVLSAVQALGGELADTTPPTITSARVVDANTVQVMFSEPVTAASSQIAANYSISDGSLPHGNGIMLHRSCDDWVVEGNQSLGNADSGIAIFACDRTLIRNNACQNNANAGIRMSVGSEGNWVGENQFVSSGKYGFYMYEGNDPPEEDDVGDNEARCRGNTFTNNFIEGYGAEALKFSNGDSNVFAGNIFIGQNTLLRFENGTNNLVAGNILPSDTLVKMVGPVTNGITGFTTTAFADQPRLSIQLDPYSTATFTNHSGAIFVSDQTALATVVRPEGSVAILTSAQVGTGPGQVFTRNFFAVPNTGSAQINVTTWNLGGRREKAWTVQGSSGSMGINYRVGDLNPGTSYVVKRGSVRLTTIKADQGGHITFTSTPESTASVIYTVNRN